ncbi:unnamed protein product [Musa acuminata subsp. burmannicoides]
MFHFLLLFHLLFFAPSLASIAIPTDALPGCSGKCGNVSIPYPFGTSSGCYLSHGFYVSCNTTYNPPKLFLSTTDIEVAEISQDGVTIYTPIARDCFSGLGLGTNINSISTDVTGLPYTFSYSRNMFTALGCDTVALNYQSSFSFSSGCLSYCSDKSSIVNGSCAGIGCCQTSIPKGLKSIYTILRSVRNHSTTWTFSPCSYAFLVDRETFVFNLTDLDDFYTKNNGVVPVVMDWAIGSRSCEDGSGSPDFSCGDNSHCVNSTNGRGYRCSCNTGYRGNPYLTRGCQDINECEDPATNPCAAICENTAGGYICSCPRGFSGDGRRSGSGCIKDAKRFPLFQVVLGCGLGLLFLLITGSWLIWGLKKRRQMRLQEKFFEQNGGLLLQQRIASSEGAAETARIFTAEELERATDNYSESRVVGRGGYGIVYRGILRDNRVVAIKKSRVIDESQLEQFINEVVILSQVIHRNVVRILGCCLETQVPLLVYEYVPNGNLHHHVHGQGRASSLSWETRLRIAAETAGALAYLHSATARPIFHRDVKSANILLDENHMAKVSDFGASRLIPMDRMQITTLVQGTLGYLDPEYFQTGQLTEKSDVYSFGVVLAELLTGLLPISQARRQEEQNLAIYFLVHMREDRLFEILEPRVRNEGNREQLLTVAELTRRCLRLRGNERPTMTEVAAELERTRRQREHPWLENEHGESQSLLREPATVYYTSPITGDEDLDAHIMLSLEMTRG